jgi:hypothetical protein
MWSKLTKGNKIIGPAGIVALVCFFMPWVLVSCENQPVASFTGMQLAAGGRVGSGLGAQPLRGSPELFLVLFAAAGCIALVYLAYRGRMAVRRAAAFAIGLAALSLLLMFAKFAGAPGQTSQMGAAVKLDLQYGFWGSVLANLAIVAGGVIELRSVGQAQSDPQATFDYSQKPND